MADVFITGIVLGVVRLKTRSLWSTILFHSLGNLVALVATAASLRG
jgi:membrane protease YdiL (CAAX protease family)